ncbi:Uncharacterized protein FWK35_00017671 [Aphis craccivora]|uniref:Uncharacterized protein n=1 Tax=Aphis craccivora TaxID=307492 RepID=A0A6G0XZ34_APHCR|nr:Uncharacterized protein FWK35_00017671 [Aphis craccivora]
MEVSIKTPIPPQSQIDVTSIVNTSQNTNYTDEPNYQEPNIVEPLNEFELSLDSSSSDSEQAPNRRLIIANWAIRHDITHCELNDLLKKLPKDARTLLKTPTTTIVKNIGGGIYHHFGIKDEIEELVEINQNIPSVLTLLAGINGLPICKNSSSELWPILGHFTNITCKKQKVFIIGAYYGKNKPTDSNEFLEDFVNDIKMFAEGVIIKGKEIKVSLQVVICDAPAKSFILNIRGDTGKHSFPRCYSVDIPFDYMHCIFIGVMKKLLLFWIGSPKHNETLPSNLIDVIDEKLIHLTKYIPNEFQRKQNSRRHPLRDANRWKATELRQCLLYTERRLNYDYEKSNPEDLKSFCGPINTHCKEKNTPMVDDSCTPQYSEWRTLDGLVLKIDDANNCVKMLNGNIVEITTKKSDQSTIVIGRCYEKFNDFFHNPCSSSMFGIQIVKQLGHLQAWDIGQVKMKLVRLPIDNYSSLIITFVHEVVVSCHFLRY